MIEQTETVDKPGEGIFNDANASAAVRLKQEHASLAQDPQKRGRGRPKGSKSAPKPEPGNSSAVPSSAPDLQRESFNRQMGMVHRAMGNIGAVATNCTAWLLDEKEEKDLGEALGNVLFDLGFASSLAVKVVALAAVESSVWGFKFMQYRAYVHEMNQAQTVQNEAQKRNKPVSNPDPYTSTPGLM